MEIGNNKKSNTVLLSVFIVSALFIVFVANYIIHDKTEKLKEDKYHIAAKEMQEQTRVLIDEKRNATLSIAMAMASGGTLKEAILKNKPEMIDLHNFSLELRKNTDFKNVWFQVITDKGVSFKRSWVKKRDDLLLKARIDIAQMLKNPKIMSVISISKFDMTFRTMVPIYDQKRFIGIFEVITHFNSIAKKLVKKGIEPVMLVDKRYKEQLIKPFTKLFVGEYYVANLNANKEKMRFLANKTVEYFINSDKKYHVAVNDFITMYKLPDIQGNPMGYFILFKPIGNIKIDEIKSFKQTIIFFSVVAVILLGILVFYISNKRYVDAMAKQNLELEELNKKLSNKNIELNIQEKKTADILNSQPYIMILTNGSHIVEANSEFFKFFEQYKTVEEFRKEHECICDFFEPVDEEDYVYQKEIDGLTWLNLVLKNRDKDFKVAMKKNGKLLHFLIKANETKLVEEGDKFIIMNFVDISNEVNAMAQIRQKDKLLYQQSKMAAMGEMIGNIAHQWRQPLSAISTAASGMKIQKEFGNLSDKIFFETTDKIVEITQHLSKTIDDFRNFFKTDKEKAKFNLKSVIEKDLVLLEAIFKNNDILLIKELDDNIVIDGYENELTQALLNIVNNAKDIVKEKPLSEDKFIFINTFLEGDNAIVSIKDNGGGIPDDIIDKIFEPYFTTKHQSQGTGIGLYMTRQIIVDNMHGSIEVENDSYEYNGKEYKGAKFTITLPTS